MLLDSASSVTGFVRPGPSAAGSFHFVGVQVADAAAFDELPLDRPVNSIGGHYDQLIERQPGAVRGFVASAAFWDVGTVGDYWATSMAFAAGAPEHGRNVHVDPRARIGGSILWDDVRVGPGAVLDDCIVADGVMVPPGARYRRAVLVASEQGVTASPFD